MHYDIQGSETASRKTPDTQYDLTDAGKAIAMHRWLVLKLDIIHAACCEYGGNNTDNLLYNYNMWHDTLCEHVGICCRVPVSVVRKRCNTSNGKWTYPMNLPSTTPVKWQHLITL